MKKYIYISLLTFTMALTACSSLDETGVADAIAVDGQNIRMHATIKSGTRIDVPSDNKTDWIQGDMIFMILDGGDADKGFKATYDGSTWSFAEWYKNGQTPDFKPEGGTITFAMVGDNLDLSTDKPSNYSPSKDVARVLTGYITGTSKKIGDIMSTYNGTYTVDKNGVVDIYLTFERPMAKIHIIGAYIGATQIRNHIEGTMPGGMDNKAGTNANYNISKSMTLNEINRYFPNTQTFRDKTSGSSLTGASNMVYSARPEDAQIVDAVYYGTMQPDDNGDITIVMCTTASTYKGIEGNAALGSNAMVAYWRKFPGKSINPGDNIYIYGPMSEEEATLWTSQGINGEMNFTQASLTLAENQQVNFKPYCKWKAPAPSDRSLTFEISDPSVITLSEDGNTLYTSGPGTSTITATTASGYQSTMTVSVKEVQELVDVTKSTWGTSFSSTYNVGWRFLNNTVVDLVVTRVAMMIPDGSGGYQEVVSQGDLSLLARASNGSASGELRVKEENVTKLPTSILRITYTYNGNPYTIDVPFSNP